MFNAFIKKVVIDLSVSVAEQLNSALVRGQWLYINGCNARLVNHSGNRVVVMLYNRNGQPPEMLVYK